MYTDSMVSFLCISHASTRRLRCQEAIFVLLQLALSVANLQAALSLNTNFNFRNFENTDDQLIFLDDAMRFYRAAQGEHYIILNAGGVAAQVPTCGRVLFKERVHLLNNSSGKTTAVASFSTVFTFSINALEGEHGDGFTFMFSTDNHTQGDPGGYMCAIKEKHHGESANHMFAVEFDTFKNTQFNDPSDNHVGVNINSVNSISYNNLCGHSVSNCTYLVNEGDFTAWIDYSGHNLTLEIRLANGSITEGVKKPSTPILRVPQLDLGEVFLEYMYVGFSGAVGSQNQFLLLRSWSFSSSGIPELPAIPPTPTPTPTLEKKCSCRSSKNFAVTVGVSAASAAFLVAFLVVVLGWCLMGGYLLRRRREAFEQTLFGPRKFTYKELATATSDFGHDQLMGSGGFGQVYKGTLYGGSGEVAVKRMKHQSRQGEREFSAEISVISRIRHRNLVQILGWCRENDELLIVYEYMANSSLDRWLFDDRRAAKLTWSLRYNILRGLAAALAYLHEEWEQCILHRDIKAGNVLLDGTFNAHLADFGLARLIDHDVMYKSTMVAGTIGYLAPELPQTRKATKKSDVYSYGVLALEVACGRPVFDDRASHDERSIHDIVWQAYENESLLSVVDRRLPNFAFDALQMDLVLALGLWCTHPEPDARPTMRFVHQCMIGEAFPPPLPDTRPVSIFDDSS